MQQVYVIKTRKKHYYMTIIARPVDNDDAMTIVSLMADVVLIRPLWGRTPGNKAYNNQLTCYATDLCRQN